MRLLLVFSLPSLATPSLHLTPRLPSRLLRLHADLPPSSFLCTTYLSVSILATTCLIGRARSSCPTSLAYGRTWTPVTMWKIAMPTGMYVFSEAGLGVSRFTQRIILPVLAAGSDVCCFLIDAASKVVGLLSVACTRYTSAVPIAKDSDQEMKVQMTNQFIKKSAQEPQGKKLAEALTHLPCALEILVRVQSYSIIGLHLSGYPSRAAP